jgi:hypothetical protein
MTHLPSGRDLVGKGRLGARLALAATLLPLAVGGGCGLFNTDIATVSFDLPARSYAFDTSQTGWNPGTSTAFAMVPTIPCTASADCCPVFVTAAGIDCTMLVCDAPTQSCAFTVTVETPPQSVNLKNEVPELASYSSQSVLDITLSRLTFDVNVNSLNVDLPPVDLFVASQNATSTADPSAVKFGTVPVIPKMTTATGSNVTLDPAGKTAFEKIAMNFGTPFVFLARTQVVVPGGTPAPTGALTLTIHGRLSAKPNL